MNDAISRQEALRTDCFGDGHDGLRAFHVYEDYLKMRKYLESLPPAEPERKKGMWNVIQGDIVVCSECGMPAPELMTGCLVNRHLEPIRTNFCPNCGSQMERGGET